MNKFFYNNNQFSKIIFIGGANYLLLEEEY
jgi:hypothetical protein